MCSWTGLSSCREHCELSGWQCGPERARLSRQWVRKDVQLCQRAGNEDPHVHPALGQGKSRTPAGELRAGSASCLLPSGAAPTTGSAVPSVPPCLWCTIWARWLLAPSTCSPPSCCTFASRACSHLHSLLFCGPVIFSPLVLLLFGDVQCKSTELSQIWLWHLTGVRTMQLPGSQGPL